MIPYRIGFDLGWELHKGTYGQYVDELVPFAVLIPISAYLVSVGISDIVETYQNTRRARNGPLCLGFP